MMKPTNVAGILALTFLWHGLKKSHVEIELVRLLTALLWCKVLVRSTDMCRKVVAAGSHT